MINLLEIMFDDKDDWISYWAWEKQFEEDYKDGDVVDNDGSAIPLATASDLCDLLVKNMEEYDD